MTPTQKNWAKARAVRAGIRLQRNVPWACNPAVDCTCSVSVNYHDLRPAHQHTLSELVRRASTGEVASAKPFWPIAILSTIVGVLCVLPYTVILKRDPGSPLCISFLLHIAVVAVYLPKAPDLLLRHKIPCQSHAMMVLMGCLFTLLKAHCLTQMPTFVCLLVFNCQMVVGVVVQFAVFGRRYSGPQLAGVALVTLGIAWASGSMQRAKAQGGSAALGPNNYLLGITEALASAVALVLLNSTVRSTFAKFGEHVQEQIFIQHLCSLLVVFPSQWGAIGPRLAAWATGEDKSLLALVALCVALNVAARALSVKMAGRAPNALMTQLMQTLESFLQLLLATFLQVPPWPPGGFWMGAAVLTLGILHYLRASEAPSDGDDGEQREA